MRKLVIYAYFTVNTCGIYNLTLDTIECIHQNWACFPYIVTMVHSVRTFLPESKCALSIAMYFGAQVRRLIIYEYFDLKKSGSMSVTPCIVCDV